MQIKVTKAQDLITPSLARNIARLANPSTALKAAATVLVSLATRAFNDASLRPTPWRALAAATLAQRARDKRGTAILKRTGTLARSPRVVSVNNRQAVIGSDRRAGSHSLAAIHQLGTKNGKMPARPFFPFTASGIATSKARSLTAVAINKVLALRK